MPKEQPSILRYGWLLVIWWGLICASQFGVLVASGIDTQLSLMDTIVSQIPLGLVVYGLTLLLKFYQPERKGLVQLFRSMVEWTLVSAGVLAFVQHEALVSLISDSSYSVFVDKTIAVRVFVDWLLIFITVMAGWLWYYYQDQEEIKERKDTNDRLLRDAELASLRQQLHPHFLFNSLNSITALAGTQPEQARKMVQQLSDFLRGTLKKEDKQMVTLEEELNHLQLYLEIEKVRFGHRMETMVEQDKTAAASKLPSLILQPIVENAIKFGLYDTVGSITITVRAWLKDHMLHLEVVNPFDPATSVPRTGTGFGLSSVQRRLFLIYSRNDLLSTNQKDNSFITHIKIPQPA